MELERWNVLVTTLEEEVLYDGWIDMAKGSYPRDAVHHTVVEHGIQEVTHFKVFNLFTEESANMMAVSDWVDGGECLASLTVVDLDAPDPRVDSPQEASHFA